MTISYGGTRMARNLSLSQAARLIGVTRKDIQKKIQQNKLVVMEGTVLLEDLKKAYPDAQYEDNRMLEKTQKLMKDAVYKMAQSEHEGAQLDALSRRAYRLNQELIKQKAKSDYYQNVLNQLRHKFIELSTSDKDIHVISEIQQWLQKALDDYEQDSGEKESQLSEQIHQFMQPHVRLLPSRHDFISDKSQTLLESALTSGMAVDYGCNNGQCGKCKVKLLSGQIKSCKHSDYIFTPLEKKENYILTCVNSAVTDVVLETHEAVSVDEIPKQTIQCKIKSLQLINDTTYILDLKTPRSQRLRFLAGQSIKLILNDTLDQNTSKPYSDILSIASCPCDDRNIQFHFAKKLSTEFFVELTDVNKKLTTITLEGPNGHFILDEESSRSIVFIAEKTHFAAIKSLIEHALALDLESNIQLIWLVENEKQLYLNNQCRAWNDALDNFKFTPLVMSNRLNAKQQIEQVLTSIDSLSQLINYDFYLATNPELLTPFKQQLIANSCKEEQIHIKL